MKGQLLHKVFHTLTEAFQNCLRRFPSTVCFVLALTVYLVYLVATDMDDDRKLVMVLGYYFSIGTLLSLTLHLWREEIKSKIKGVIVHIVMHVLLIADAVYLYSLSPEQSLTEIGIAHGAAILALWLSAFFLFRLFDHKILHINHVGFPQSKPPFFHQTNALFTIQFL